MRRPRAETMRKVILPAAIPGIMGGVLLAMSRAIGETMIVVMAAGLIATLTINPLESVTTVTVQIVTLLIGDTEFDSPKTWRHSRSARPASHPGAQCSRLITATARYVWASHDHDRSTRRRLRLEFGRRPIEASAPLRADRRSASDSSDHALSVLGALCYAGFAQPPSSRRARSRFTIDAALVLLTTSSAAFQPDRQQCGADHSRTPRAR
jgi:hypothetical protein